jgi:hypothetical protein
MNNYSGWIKVWCKNFIYDKSFFVYLVLFVKDAIDDKQKDIKVSIFNSETVSSFHLFTDHDYWTNYKTVVENDERRYVDICQVKKK